ERWQALAAFRAGRIPADASRGALAAIDQASRQWRRRLRLDALPPGNAAAHRLGDLLAHAWPDRIAQQHPADPHRYQLANGRSARLSDASAVSGEPGLLATERRAAQGARKDSTVLRAAPLDPARLERDWPHR